MNSKIIDLANYKDKNAKFIFGRKNGENAFNKEKIAELVDKRQKKEIEKIKIICSDSIYGVVSSFILGMLSSVISNMKNKNEVYDVFDFSDLEKHIQTQFDEEIKYILGEK